jgi:hypothetical protein
VRGEEAVVAGLRPVGNGVLDEFHEDQLRKKQTFWNVINSE